MTTKIQLPVGDELDVLVAEKVMGYSWVDVGDSPWDLPALHFPPPHEGMIVAHRSRQGSLIRQSYLKHYSIYIQDAWQLLESRPLGKWCPSIRMADDGVWWCEIKIGYNTSYRTAAVAHAKTAPHAICLATIEAAELEAMV
jgi:hypothetical protein